MLDQLMRQLAQGTTLSVEGLAERLNTTPALVEMMLEHLERQGLVQSVQLCQGLCEDCPFGSYCAPKEGRRLWQTKAKP